MFSIVPANTTTKMIKQESVKNMKAIGKVTNYKIYLLRHYVIKIVPPINKMNETYFSNTVQDVCTKYVIKVIKVTVNFKNEVIGL